MLSVFIRALVLGHALHGICLSVQAPGAPMRPILQTVLRVVRARMQERLAAWLWLVAWAVARVLPHFIQVGR